MYLLTVLEAKCEIKVLTRLISEASPLGLQEK